MPRYVSGHLLGAILLSAASLAATSAAAQDNPFVPSNGASTADIERIIDARMKAAEAKMTALIAASKPAGGAPAGGATPGGPGSPIPGSPGAIGTPLAPGGISSYGSPGGGQMQMQTVDPMAMAQGQRYNVSPEHVRDIVPGMDNPVFVRQQAGDIRFLGCINGVPKFVSKQTGQRASFSARDITEAQKTGVVPVCR
jgi:hypothetical protein